MSYCDNYFRSVPLLKELLQMKIYASGTVRCNKRGLPDVIKQPPKMRWEEYKSLQDANSHLVATVWHDNRPVRVLSTNARPDVTFPIERKCGNATVHIDQPENVFLYDKYMNGVDKHDQLRMKYSIGWFSVKAWKYFTLVLCQCMPGQCLHPVCKNINQANKEEVCTSWLLAWCGAWSDSWLFCKKAKIRCSAAYKTRCTQWPVNPWKCAYGCKGKKMQVALYAKREKRNSVWVQDLQCPSV